VVLLHIDKLEQCAVLTSATDIQRNSINRNDKWSKLRLIIAISDISLKTRFFKLHFTRRMCRCIFNRFYAVGPKSYRIGEIKPTTRPLCRSRSFKVTDFGTNQKLVYDFLLVINANFPPIMGQIFASERECLTLTHTSVNITSPETRKIVLSKCWKPDDRMFIPLDKTPKRDGRTDGRTDRQISSG